MNDLSPADLSEDRFVEAVDSSGSRPNQSHQPLPSSHQKSSVKPFKNHRHDERHKIKTCLPSCVSDQTKTSCIVPAIRDMRPLTPSTSYKLFATGATVGPLVDSLHNQCLLRYNVLPITVPNPLSDDPTAYWLCSSWTVPPLLGIAYVVLGGLLPRWLERGLQTVGVSDNQRSSSLLPVPLSLSQRAWMAVATTAVIIKLSELLETHPSMVGTTTSLEAITGGTAPAQILVLLIVALFQWALLDATWSALLTASIVSIGGPLSELPFVAQGVWGYLPAAGDYLPLADLPSWLPSAPTSSTMTMLLGEDYRTLALSSITGPCYFAVTMDAIALGRWFDRDTRNEQ